MRLLRWSAAILIVLLVLAVLLIWTAPAELAYRFAADRLGPLRAMGLSGSVWQGRAERVSAFAVPLGALDWRLARGAALRGRIDGELTLDGEQVDGAARVEGGAGRLTLRDVSARFPARLLGPALDIPALALLGDVRLEVAEAELVDGLLQRARGRAEWRELGVAGAAAAALPGLVAEFDDAPDGGIAATVRDLGGALAVDGRVLLRDGRFRAETRLSLREPDPQLQEVLTYIGERTPDGGSLLRIEGTLTPLW